MITGFIPDDNNGLPDDLLEIELSQIELFPLIKLVAFVVIIEQAPPGARGAGGLFFRNTNRVSSARRLRIIIFSKVAD
jgi:hypothetical protein